MRLHAAEVRWMRIGKPCLEALEAACKPWLGTPWMPNQRAKGIGVDCRELAVALYDRLYRTQKPSFLPALPQDMAIHVPLRDLAPTIRAMTQDNWFGMDVVRDGSIEPGDLVVTKGEVSDKARTALSHCMIAGPRPFTALHSVEPVGVVWTTIAATRGIVRVYRPRNKAVWRLSSPN